MDFDLDALKQCFQNLGLDTEQADELTQTAGRIGEQLEEDPSRLKDFLPDDLPGGIIGNMPDGLLGSMMDSVFGTAPDAAENAENLPPKDFNPQDFLSEVTMNLPGNMGQKINEMLGSLFGDDDSIDLEEETAEYQPQAEDSAERAFVTELRAWVKWCMGEMTAKQPTALQLGYFCIPEEPKGIIWLACRTGAADDWNVSGWADYQQLDDDVLQAFLESQGYDLLEDEEELTERIYDLAVVALMELRNENAMQNVFGKEIPIVVEGRTYRPKTAVRASKINQKELLDAAFMAACGIE
ncbi:MAG: hypothetical protein MJ071_02185 [Oscillospiraceae bacterium]|nr:hypothetical protein [Oscillospiraceae bacterium]